MRISEALHILGLSGKEAAVYTALLSLGGTTAYVIANRADVKTSTTYVVLDSLIKKGAARRVPRARKHKFVAVPPQEVFAIAEERLNFAKQALPEIKSLLKKQKGRIQTLYFEGINGLKEALSYRIKDQKGKEAVGFYAANVGISSEALATIEDWLTLLKDNKISMRGFVPKHKALQRYAVTNIPQGREFRSLSYEKYSSTVSLDTICDFARIVDATSPIPQAIIIENPAVASMLRQTFDIMWDVID